MPGFFFCAEIINNSMKINEIVNAQENIGPATKDVCKSNRPDSSLPASWLASCR